MILLINGISDRWFAYMGSAAIQATLLALLVLVVIRVGRRWPPALRHAILMLAVCKFLVPPMLSLPTGVFSRVRTQEWFRSEPELRSIAPVLQSENSALQGLRSYLRHASSVKEPLNRQLGINKVHNLPDPKPSLSTKGTLLLIHFWGALAILAVTALQQRRLRTVALRATQPIDPGLVQIYEALCHRLQVRRQPRLRISAENHAPVTFGLLKPVVILPRATLEALPPEEIRAILGHELAHHRRRDPWFWRLHVIVSAFWWFNPVYWLLARTVRSVREDCCDDMVIAAGIASREGYCRTLLQAARAACSSALTGGALAHFVEPHPLQRRLHRIMTARSIAFPRLATWGLMAIMALALLLLPGIGSDARAQNSARIEAVSPNMHFSPPELAAVIQTPDASSKGENRTQEENLYSQAPTPMRQAYSTQGNEIPGFYRKWLEEDVAYIISESEGNAFRQLATDEEREAFIDRFWALRNSGAHSAGNSFKEEHYRRIAYANERFAAKVPGWKTDRGRIYIRFGEPDSIESYPADGVNRQLRDENREIPTMYPFERWRYRQMQGISGENIEIEFVDKSGKGDYRMAVSPDEKYAPVNEPIPVSMRVLIMHMRSLAGTTASGQ